MSFSAIPTFYFFDFFSYSSARICGDFLKREWIQADGTREQGAKYNEHLQYLLKYESLQSAV